MPYKSSWNGIPRVNPPGSKYRFLELRRKEDKGGGGLIGRNITTINVINAARKKPNRITEATISLTQQVLVDYLHFTSLFGRHWDTMINNIAISHASSCFNGFIERKTQVRSGEQIKKTGWLDSLSSLTQRDCSHQ